MYEFDNILNARDFGSYASKYGTFKSEKLLRSAHLADASPRDLERLDALDLGLIVDLRYLSERERQPNKWPRDTGLKIERSEQKNIDQNTVKVLGFDATRTGQAPHEAFIESDLNDPNDARAYMVHNYTARPHNRSFQKIFSDTLSHMAEQGGGLIIHCAAGKDRTGTLVALIQSLLGMSHDDIMSDYMKTMDSVDVEGLLAIAAPRISKRFGRTISADMLWPMFSVEPEYLKASLKAIGDPHKYAYDILGLSKGQEEALISNYIA